MAKSFVRKFSSSCLRTEITENSEGGVPRDGRVRLRDGRTGEYFDSPVNNRYMHYLQTASSGRRQDPCLLYSLTLRNTAAVGGKAQFGGQCLERWRHALEAYGASYTPQETDSEV